MVLLVFLVRQFSLLLSVSVVTSKYLVQQHNNSNFEFQTMRTILLLLLLYDLVTGDGYGHKKCHYEYDTVYETVYHTIYKKACETHYNKKCHTGI